ncbi:alpha/beta hydrolase [Rapidithrix thailandica]|uniref:Alpha/beta hydrolase n=1 Tax=Rapidithrix thailandica TaxID=413964 RepID=A0AAW9RSE8_9BACT
MSKKFKYSVFSGGIIFLILINFIAYNHAYQFTHFTNSPQSHTRITSLAPSEKLKVLFNGFENSRPKNRSSPSQNYQTIHIQGYAELEAWYCQVENPLGIVIMFHGYRGKKSRMINKAEEILKMGYNTLLVDFYGSGGSEGNSTSIGFHEAKDVIASYQYIQNHAAGIPVFLFGTSMGSAAILKAMESSDLQADGLILECPFGTLRQAVQNRFELTGVPSFILSDLLLFWGSVQNDFWAFDHNPEEYAAHVAIPTLMIYGEKDDKVKREETDAVFENLSGKKELLLLPNSGHTRFLRNHREEWKKSVGDFLKRNSQ